MSAMMKQQRKYLVKIDLPAKGAGMQRLARFASSALESMLAVDAFNKMYDTAARGNPSWQQFSDNICSYLHARWHVSDEDLARIPPKGPLVVVANHPFGGLEGVILPAIIGKVRKDVKVFATYMLKRVEEMHDVFVYVDPFGTEKSKAANIAPMRQVMRHLKDGGVLALFPAGEVSSFDLNSRQIIDPPWTTTIAGIIRRCQCPVLPLFFGGRNSLLFQAMGMIHPRLRTAMLARETMNKRGARLYPRIGSVIPFKRLEGFQKDEELIAYLRQRTYLLRHRTSTQASPPPPPVSGGRTIIPEVPAELLAADIASLPADQILVEADNCLVCHARAREIPNVMRELGRLREITFRATGEGTGKSMDVDRFDMDYIHMFIWHKVNRQIIGAYRLGPTDEILEAKGKSGLYTTTLFDCKTALLKHISPALELGRSFVRAEYQKSFAPLLLLWKGIGQITVRNPRYKYLFGPVSISNNYQSVSKQLMVNFLKAHHCPPDLVELVQARNPFRQSRIAGLDRSALKLIRDSDDVSDLVSEVEPQQKGIPVLLRQYLKMGAKLLAFNVDPGFADCVDALMVCDLSKTDSRLLDRYMGKEGRERFMQYHAGRELPAQRLNAMLT